MNIRSSGKAKRVSQQLALALFGFLMGVVIAEAGLRIAGYSYPGFYMPDESRGHALIPGREGWYRKEGGSYVRINSAGLRDREHQKIKPEKTIRIAVLGDSHAEALQVPIDQAFWAVMERKLKTCEALNGSQIEVLNFGVSGYGTAQELITLRERVWDYSPDVVLLAITTNNDVSDNSRALKQTDEAPYFVYREGELVLDESFKSSRAFQLRRSKVSYLGRWIKDHSRLLQAINEAHHGLKILLASLKAERASAEPTASQARPENPVAPKAEDLGADNLVYQEPLNDAWADAWRVTEGLIVAMRDDVNNRGSKFVVVTLSNGPQVLPNPRARRAYMKRFQIEDLFYPDNRIRELCFREKISVITLAPELQAAAERDQVFLHGFGTDLGNGHLNAVGHERAGKLTAEKLCRFVFEK